MCKSINYYYMAHMTVGKATVGNPDQPSQHFLLHNATQSLVYNIATQSAQSY